jgi:imidazolonepropionase-like amidohydrolase
MIHPTFKPLLLGACASLALAASTTLLARTVGEPVTAASTGTVYALTNAQVVDVDTGKAQSQAVVVVADGRIQALGSAASVKIPAGAKLVDMRGKYLVPGLMNAHVHLGLKLPGLEGLQLANENLASQALREAANARKSLLAGTTTVRLVGESSQQQELLQSKLELALAWDEMARTHAVAVAGAQALNEAATLGLETLNCTLLLLPS